ncbi:Pyrroloquinoline-quinone synthase [Acidisarcina polymorpha]|uniref:Pyrroloquinoline-quinone synthase n=1 Tax=Acidisarcina polymorpha TaxID=2211140 RepID=A0A2Z5G6F3_9BACT|nr:pyrroloquinoline-quinone synthase PqqC [Acidisarcina polymorpha]AXC14681.1 Pyrroloquinoline-quinone synthase [Acidisarcina polymorpha]
MATELAVALTTEDDLLSRQELRARLLAVGEARYHHRHPFHVRMHQGELTRGQLQAWALNRYYYQSRIPIKDALLLAKSDDPAFRRTWRKRILDHDGDQDGYGGVEKWIQLAEATGLDRSSVISYRGILPGVIFAVDAYLALVRDSSLLVAVASSLTELFSRDLISLRMDKMRLHYPYLIPGLAYFEGRLTQAPEDAAFALDYVSTHARTAAEQQQVIRALERKCEILWAQLDAIDYAYVEPGYIPPGCFVPGESSSAASKTR